MNKEIKNIEELEKWQKESKIYEVDFKGKIYIREILSKEEFKIEFNEYVKKILHQLEEDYYITGSKFSNKTKFHKIKLSKKHDNWRVLLTKTVKIIKHRKVSKLVKSGIEGYLEEKWKKQKSLYIRHKIQQLDKLNKGSE